MKNVTIRRSRPKQISDKQAAKRLAAGETFLRSSVRPSPPSGSSIKKGPKKNAKQAKPRKKVKPVNRARRKREFSRAYGGESRVGFVRSLPCGVCGNASTAPCENAHIVTGGMGRKADAKLIVPLCSPHHQSLHKRGRETFEGMHGISLASLAANTEAAWQSHLSNQQRNAS